MESALAELRAALEHYFSAIASQKTDHPVPLPPVFARLQVAEDRALPHAPPRLRHFLESKSYRKAYNFLVQVGVGSKTEAV